MTQFISFGITWTLINSILGSRVLEAHVDGIHLVVIESTPQGSKANVTWGWIANPTGTAGDYGAGRDSHSGAGFKTARRAAWVAHRHIEALRRRAASERSDAQRLAA